MRANEGADKTPARLFRYPSGANQLGAKPCLTTKCQYIDAKAAANVALIVLTHTLAFLLRHKRINRAELDEIFGTVTQAYSSLIVPTPTQTWQKQIQPLVALTHSDVLRWAQAVKRQKADNLIALYKSHGDSYGHFSTVAAASYAARDP